ncbi:Nuclear pore complex protein NUP85 [Coccomyxa sp. Obi]|nr:Nuclear pore complex protein NUP85 [Coccomyxa sp. Obi]
MEKTDHSQTTSTVKWNALAASERRVAYDSLPAFQALRTKLAGGSRTVDTSDLQEYAESISNTLAPSIDRVGEEDVYGQPQEAAMWDLLRVFYLGPFTDGSFVEALSAWMQRHARVLTMASSSNGEAMGPSLPEQVESLHSAESATERQPEYWPVLQRLVGMGMTEDAVGLLGLHSAWQLAYSGGNNHQMLSLISILEPAILLLRRMPRLRPAAPADASVQAFDDPHTFMEHRHAWQGQVRQLLQDASLWSKAATASRQTANGVRELLNILVGADSCLVSSTGTWLEHLLAMCLHVYPSMRPQADLEPVLHKSLATKDGGGVELLIVLEGFVQAAAKQELQEVLEVCSRSFSPWFMAHIPDLLARHPSAPATLGRFLPHFGADQAEFYTLEYASALMTTPQTWELAVEYLAWCPVHGQAALQRFLEQLPVGQESEDLALKALQVCQRYGMRAAERGICITVGMERLQQGHLAAALQWLGRAGDERALEAAARTLVQSIAEHSASPTSTSGDLERSLEDLEAMSCAATSGSGRGIGQGMFGLIRSYIAFLKALGRGSRLQAEAPEEAEAASGALLQLMKHPSLPAVTRSHLLFNAIELLEAPTSPPLFTAADTQELLSHLLETKEMEGRSNHAAEMEGAGQDEQHFLQAKLDAVQLALSRNLARAHIAAPLA